MNAPDVSIHPRTYIDASRSRATALRLSRPWSIEYMTDQFATRRTAELERVVESLSCLDRNTGELRGSLRLRGHYCTRARNRIARQRDEVTKGPWESHTDRRRVTVNLIELRCVERAGVQL